MNKALYTFIFLFSSLSLATTVTRIAGDGHYYVSQTDNKKGTRATFFNHQQPLLDQHGNLLVLDAGKNSYMGNSPGGKIRKVVLKGSYPVSTLAGNNINQEADHKNALLAQLVDPYRMTKASNGDIYFTSLNTGSIRKYNKQGVTTLPIPKSNQINFGIATDDKYLYINGYWYPEVKKYDLSGTLLHTYDFSSHGCLSDGTTDMTDANIVYKNNKLYTSCQNVLIEVDLSNDSSNTIYATNSNISAIDVDDNGLIYVGYDKYIDIVNPKSGYGKNIVETGSMSESEGINGIAVKTAEKLLYYTGNSSAGGVYEVKITNNPPIIKSNDGRNSVSLSMPENTTEITTIEATDVDNDVVTFAIDGEDASLFDINSSSGKLTFSIPPNFEAPKDKNSDNIYNVNVVVSDSNLDSSDAIQSYIIKITDLNEVTKTTMLERKKRANQAINTSQSSQLKRRSMNMIYNPKEFIRFIPDYNVLLSSRQL